MFENDLKKEIDYLLGNSALFEVKEIENNLATVFDSIAMDDKTLSQTNEAVFYILSELSDNIKQHSKALKCWILYKKDERNIIILVADNGIGIPAVFEAYFPDLHENDLGKVREALEKGVSTKGEGRGYGLRTVRGIVDATAGEMIIISGGVGYKISGSKKDPLKLDTVGTVIVIKIPIDATLESSQFYKIIEGKNERN
jgi:signal transduction histidine kinase